MPPFVAATRREFERVAPRMVDRCSGAHLLRGGRAVPLEGNCVLPARTRENLCRFPASEPALWLQRPGQQSAEGLQPPLSSTRSSSAETGVAKNLLLAVSTPARLAHLLPISRTMLSIAASIGRLGCAW